ncbi:hypothetical protein D3C72_2550150 [compost metagenome]
MVALSVFDTVFLPASYRAVVVAVAVRIRLSFWPAVAANGVLATTTKPIDSPAANSIAVVGVKAAAPSSAMPS